MRESERRREIGAEKELSIARRRFFPFFFNLNLNLFLLSFTFFLFISFDRLTRNTGTITLADLAALPELQGNPFVPTLFAFLCREAGKTKKNETLSVVEFGRALERLNGGASEEESNTGLPSSAAAVFRVLDSDADGRLSLEELEAALRPVLLKRSDKSNKSGSESESSGVPAALAAGAALQKHDADGDGALSLPEFRSLLAAAAGGR